MISGMNKFYSWYRWLNKSLKESIKNQNIGELLLLDFRDSHSFFVGYHNEIQQRLNHTTRSNSSYFNNLSMNNSILQICFCSITSFSLFLLIVYVILLHSPTSSLFTKIMFTTELSLFLILKDLRSGTKVL